MGDIWTECYAEVHVSTIREKRVKVTVTVAVPADLDVNSGEAEAIIKDLIADDRYSMMLAK